VIRFTPGGSPVFRCSRAATDERFGISVVTGTLVQDHPATLPQQQSDNSTFEKGSVLSIGAQHVTIQPGPRTSNDSLEAPSAVPTQSTHPVTEADIPARPTLAPGVELVGQMQGSGFTDQQWLVQRDGRFIQVTELLYRVLEQTDGTRTLSEIAIEVGNATNRLVSPDNIRHLIQVHLASRGLVALADGSSARRVEDGERSALQIGLRRNVLGPRVIDPIARVLQVLYAPPIIIPILVLIAVAHVWLYTTQGIADSVRAVLFTPGGLIIVVATAIVSGIFHEFGHAAAQRYGGGKVRGMGVGVYLVYPTFYTDVTDAYRLGRWARVRTDLGGIYFHLIFALGLMGLYFLTGQELFLAVVMVINADVLYQSLPFVRLDGYWAVADLTGISDPLSQIGPFLRRALPAPGQAGKKLPPLKPWVRNVFIGYIVLAIPAIAILFYLMISNAPGFLALSWESLLYQTQVLADAYNAGDTILTIAAVTQILLLAFSMLALVYLLFTVAKKPVRAVWRWSLPTPARRVVGAFAAVGAALLLLFLWAPNLPFVGPSIPEGVEKFEISDRLHVQVPVDYSHVPPVGGNHAPLWQNCGFYDTPIADENAVHSLEHGAVWIAYRPGLDEDQIATLRNLAGDRSHVIVSLYPDLSAPLVATAWGHQLRLDSANDPRLDEFVNAFHLGRQAPERGGPCSGGVGTPN
jgi:putative peptide zinc metalloprotease protein